MIDSGNDIWNATDDTAKAFRHIGDRVKRAKAAGAPDYIIRKMESRLTATLREWLERYSY